MLRVLRKHCWGSLSCIKSIKGCQKYKSRKAALCSAFMGYQQHFHVGVFSGYRNRLVSALYFFHGGVFVINS